VKPSKILIVDADRTSRLVLSRWLGKRMPEVELLDVSNGTAAVRTMTTDQPDVILTELVLPDLDGEELIQRIRALPNGDDVVIIAVTAQAMSGDRERGLALGCDDYVTKPISPRDVEARVRAWLQERRRHDQ
jgi:CheY-like chemotaxis protein